MDILGMDVTWTAEFAEAGWIRELTGEQKAAATEDVLQPPIDTATWKDKLYGIPRSTNVQLLWYRKSLVPEAAQDLGRRARCVARSSRPRASPTSSASPPRSTRATWSASTRSSSSLGGTLVNEDSTKVTVDDKTVEGAGDPQGPRDRRPGQQVAVEQPGARGLRADAERRGRVHHELALRARRRCKTANEDVADDLGVTRIPEFEPGTPSRATLGGMNYAISKLQQAPGPGLRGGDVPAQPGEPARGRARARRATCRCIKSVYEEPEFEKAYPMKDGHPRGAGDGGAAAGDAALPEHLHDRVDARCRRRARSTRRRRPTSSKDKIQQAIDGKGILP